MKRYTKHSTTSPPSQPWIDWPVAPSRPSPCSFCLA